MDEQNQPPVAPENPQPQTPPQPAAEAPLLPSEFEPATVQNQSTAMGVPQPAPVGVTNQEDEQPTQPLPVKRKKWPVIAAVVAGLVVVLGGGSALAYTWYQNPQRVIMDGLANALQAKTLTYTGTMNVTNPAEKTTVKLGISGAAASGNGKLDITATVDQQSQHYSLSGSGVFGKDGNLYIRFQDIDKVLDAYLKSNPDTEIPASARTFIDQLIAKFNNKWIEVSASDLQDYSASSSNAFDCLKQASDTLRNDQNVRKELATLYQKNPFIRVDKDLGTKDGSIGYAISPDTGKEKAFLTGVKNTAFYKKIHGCDGDFDINEQDISSNSTDNTQTEIWLSQWQHQITRINVNAKDTDGVTTDMSWQPQFNKPVTVDIPSGAVTISELKDDIQSIMMEYMMSQLGSGASSALTPGQNL